MTAAQRELSSWTGKFPASWENTGNFARWVFRAQADAPNSSAISKRYWEIPCAPEQGIFCSLTGNEIAPSGNILAGIREIPLLPSRVRIQGKRQPIDVNLYIFRHFLSVYRLKNLHIPTPAANMCYAEVFEERRGRQACESRQPEVLATGSTDLESAASPPLRII